MFTKNKVGNIHYEDEFKNSDLDCTLKVHDNHLYTLANYTLMFKNAPS